MEEEAMIIPIASDHAGFEAKEKTIGILEKMGHIPVDFGTHSGESVDYPDFAVQVAKKVSDGEHTWGILICGSGQGMCMTANKYPDVRAALVYNSEIATLTRRHNNANVLCLPGRELDSNQLVEILEAWISAEFEGGRHERRIEKIKRLTDEK
ncbi:MAG: ribose 5-phosphate isomerase B [Balneolaceae bacterium]